MATPICLYCDNKLEPASALKGPFGEMNAFYCLPCKNLWSAHPITPEQEVEIQKFFDSKPNNTMTLYRDLEPSDKYRKEDRYFDDSNYDHRGSWKPVPEAWFNMPVSKHDVSQRPILIIDEFNGDDDELVERLHLSPKTIKL